MLWDILTHFNKQTDLSARNETHTTNNNVLLFRKHWSHGCKKKSNTGTCNSNFLPNELCSQSMTCFGNSIRAQLKHNKVKNVNKHLGQERGDNWGITKNRLLAILSSSTQTWCYPVSSSIQATIFPSHPGIMSSSFITSSFTVPNSGSRALKEYR